MSMRGFLNAVLTLCCSMGIAMSAEAANGALSMQQVGPAMFVHLGLHEETMAANQGAIANIGFIVGERCVAVIDTGGSLENGRRLRLAIRQQTALPVCYVINTHVHPDHVFGNAAFVADRPVFVGHQHLAASMSARAGHYRKILTRQLGEPAASASTMIAPTRSIASELTLDLGGRLLQLRAGPPRTPMPT
jgi:glyoxylase-like metal-dependent hydrolase (beta-lactamase superfamily II)